MKQIPKMLLNDHYVIIQKVKKIKLVNSYRAYVRKKNKMITMQHNSLYPLINEWFDNILQRIKQSLLEKTKLKSSIIIVSENK